MKLNDNCCVWLLYVGELDDEEKFRFVEISEKKDEEDASQNSVDLTRAFGNLGTVDWFVGGETMVSMPSNMIDRAHQMYREGMHEERLARKKTKLQKTLIHSNIAACYSKLHDL